MAARVEQSDLSSPAGDAGIPGAVAVNPRRSSLAWRLLLPLSLLVAGLGAAITVFLIGGVAAHLDRQAHARLERAAEMLAGSGLGLEATLLARVRDVAGVEVILLADDGRVLTSTLDSEAARGLASAPAAAGPGPVAGADGARYYVAARPLPRPRGDDAALLLVAANTQTTDRVKRSLAVNIVIGTGTGLLLLIGVGHVVVRTVTRPLQKVAEAARDVGRGDLGRRVPIGGAREIEILAREFNAMVGELARSREALLRAEKLAVAGKMAASVAHEIRNPLSSIRMTVQLLRRTAGLDPSLRRDLGDILDEVDRLDLAVRSLLDLTPATRLDRRPLDMNAVLDDTLRLTSRKLDHLKIEVHRDLAESLPTPSADESRARQAFLNVILNAAEAMSRGGTLTVATRGEANGVEVRFEDTGGGLPEGDLGRLFEPFVSTKPGGAGLGLYTVRQIMELHGGRVRLEHADEGMRCVLVFPLRAHEAAPAEAASAAVRS